MSSLATHVNQTKANKEWKSSHNPTSRERRIEEDRERMTEEKQRNGGGGGGGGGSFFRSSSEERKSSATSAAAADKKVIIKSADMKEDMQSEAIDCAISAFEKHDVEKDIAEYIKKVFDKKHGPTWHCIVGRNFGSYVTHETNHFVYFYLGQKAILLFKSG